MASHHDFVCGTYDGFLKKIYWPNLERDKKIGSLLTQNYLILFTTIIHKTET